MKAYSQGYLEQMREVKVKKSELLEKVKENRQSHISEYREAVVGYRDVALRKLADAKEYIEIQEANIEEHPEIDLKPVDLVLFAPESHEKDYDQVITMLEMSVDEEVTLRSDEFARYVMDDWDWQIDFEKTKSLYNVRSRRR